MVSYQNLLFSSTCEKTTQGIIIHSLKGRGSGLTEQNKKGPNSPRGAVGHSNSGGACLRPLISHWEVIRWAHFPGFSPSNLEARGTISQRWGDTLVWGCNKWHFLAKLMLTFLFYFGIVHTPILAVPGSHFTLLSGKMIQFWSFYHQCFQQLCLFYFPYCNYF